MSDLLDTALSTTQQYYTDAKNMLFGDGNTSLRFRSIGYTASSSNSTQTSTTSNSSQAATVTMDAVTNEEHTSNMDIAENRLETGAKISDHAMWQPLEVTVTGTVVGYEATSVQEDIVSQVAGLRASDFLDSLELPSVVNTITDSTLSMVENKLSTFINWGGLDTAVSQTLAPWLPDFSIAEQLQGSANLRIEQMYRQFLDFQKNVTFCTVTTGIMVYDNMLLRSVRCTQKQDGSAEFTLSFKEVQFVPTSYTTAVASKTSGKPAAQTATKSGRAATQAATTTNRNINSTTSVAAQDGTKQLGVLPRAAQVINSITGLRLGNF